MTPWPSTCRRFCCVVCRRCSFVRVLLILALFLTGMQILHVVLVSRLETRQETTSGFPHREDHDALYKSVIVAIESSQLLKHRRQGKASSFSLTFTRHPATTLTFKLEIYTVMDSSGHYTIVNNIIKSKTSSLPGDDTGAVVTLVSQCSANHLHHVLDLATSWQGPISVAVFAIEKQIMSTVGLISKLVECKADVLNAVSLHLVFKLAQPTKKLDLNSHLFVNEKFCNDFQQVLESQSAAAGNYAWKDVAYPTNLLRNVALENAAGSHALVIDIDMLPSHGLYYSLARFVTNFSLSENNFSGQVAFVVPAFEIQNSADIPRSKKDLMDLWQRKDVRPFYEELCWKCQRHTNYSYWKDLVTSDLLNVGYAAEWKDPWEPFYVVPKSAPRYDERFMQYGFNRISQSCELHVAGFQFLVLDNAFIIHRGFKTVTDFHDTKEMEQNQNRLLFRKFKQELKVKYPNSSHRCY